jgi:hypothetical protein
MLTDAPLGIGVIGTGFGARAHVPGFGLLDEARVVAICSERPERARAVAVEHGIPAAYGDFRELLADPAVEAVSIATPPHLHHPMAVAALLAGKHVLCEKPMARTVAEARDMLRQAQAAGVANMINHEFRFLPARQRVKELIDEGYIGELRTVSLTIFRGALADPDGRAYSWLMDQEKGGGMLGAIGSHAIDTLLWWFGPITGVTGRLATTVPERYDPASGQPRPVSADDTSALLVQFAGGALGSLHISSAAWHGAGENLEIYGSEGTLILKASGALLGARRGERRLRQLTIEPPADPAVPEETPPSVALFLRLARRFVAWARTGAPAAPTFEDGLAAQEVIGGAQKSAQDGQWAVIGGRPHELSSSSRLRWAQSALVVDAGDEVVSGTSRRTS